QPFVFTQGEQDFFAQRGLLNEPSRCPSCRAARKAGRGLGGGSARSRAGAREMFPSVCSQCGRETGGPFRPTSGKPVYCADCFAERGGGRSGGGDRSDRFSA